MFYSHDILVRLDTGYCDEYRFPRDPSAIYRSQFTLPRARREGEALSGSYGEPQHALAPLYDDFPAVQGYRNFEIRAVLPCS